MNFLELAKQYKEEAIQLLQKLVQIDSVLDESTKTNTMPFGKGINECLEMFLEYAKKDGFEVLNDEGYAGLIKYHGRTNELIGVLGHLDVVPVTDGWKFPPFSATIEDNYMYGRGVMDDKGPVVAAYIALKILKEQGIVLDKTVDFILGTDEETGWRGLEHYQQNHKLPEIGFSPDAEFPLIHGEKGIIRCILEGQPCVGFTLKGGNIFNAVIGNATATTQVDLSEQFSNYLMENNLQGDCEYKDNTYYYHIKGVPAHAMEPHKGINAGTHLAVFLNNYFEHPTLEFITNCVHNDFNMTKLGQKVTHKVMGIITNNVGIMDFNENVTKFTFDIRYPIGLRFDLFSNSLPVILDVYGIKTNICEHKVPHYIDVDDPLVETLYNAYVKYTGDTQNKPCTIGGGTYARALKKGVAFGMELPNEPSVAHQIDERINLDNLITAIAIYAEAIYMLGKTNA